jgi:hypothetical protein
MPNIHKGIDVYCDASHLGLGCVLMQEGKVIAYASRQLRKHEKFILRIVAELPEVFQLKCLSPALEARPHLNGNNPSIPRI